MELVSIWLGVGVSPDVSFSDTKLELIPEYSPVISIVLIMSVPIVGE